MLPTIISWAVRCEVERLTLPSGGQLSLDGETTLEKVSFACIDNTE